MPAFENYLKFLQEYKKLLERGVKDIFTKNISPNYIWLEDVQRLIETGWGSSIFPQLFSDKEITEQAKLLSFKKPLKPEVYIPEDFSAKIEFIEAKNIFGYLEEEYDLVEFKSTPIGKELIDKVKSFQIIGLYIQSCSGLIMISRMTQISRLSLAWD